MTFLPSLIVGLVEWGRGDAEMCQVGLGRAVLRIMGEWVGIGSEQSVIRRSSGRRCPQNTLK